MDESLHDQFCTSGKAQNAPAKTFHHPDDESITQYCKERLYNLPSGRRLFNVMALHDLRIKIDLGKTTSYAVHNRTITLTSPLRISTPLDELTIQLACAIRSIEMHMHQLMSPDVQDTMQLLGTHYSENFELALLTCKLAYEMNKDNDNSEILTYLARNEYTAFYEAYNRNAPFDELQAVLAQRSKADG